MEQNMLPSIGVRMWHQCLDCLLSALLYDALVQVDVILVYFGFYPTQHTQVTGCYIDLTSVVLSYWN